ncbi:hypothetical protein Kfla_3218 [Kribbella flavida DSM 17836]|uniref:Integral membrane protein n=1 Tax=Kribbella flavida (strain DSM 17836 / JCM 10339 / NBRC 14399) TaxID=479435 RepID=D2Q4G6_KRIFD|nr:hypothetical protein [Kribbella flavida]ADB32280.1 hypothetical protein Kfla_3218 [Kribbella flavida DSM 17836]
MATDEMRKDLRAAVAARQELGAEYEPEIIDGFLEKLDARAAARYGQQGQPLPEPAHPQPPAGKPDNDPGGLALAIVSVVAGIPITAIAANMEGTIAVIICWGGLVGVNLARAAARFVGR